ncbi:MAG: S4 domain-containing protein YaaA [Bavariicoccus seileri]|uniref:S4 domain-containing protein YaaA n=1 Tax=Bavariicoccus seileri TaxID=549685 RepID=UPI0003B6A213|nr:S4 domain-containing protein YaaA [Bavariicoccus seileri]
MTEIVPIDSEYITLTQLLKQVSVVGTGGAAKWYLQTNAVLLNGEIEQRRGKKLYPGDQVEIIDHGLFLIRKHELSHQTKDDSDNQTGPQSEDTCI